MKRGGTEEWKKVNTNLPGAFHWPFRFLLGQ